MTNHMKAIETILKLALYYIVETAWGQGAPALYKNGEQCFANRTASLDDVACFCLGAAIDRAIYEHTKGFRFAKSDVDMADVIKHMTTNNAYLGKTLMDVVAWNDSPYRKRAEIVALLEKSIRDCQYGEEAQHGRP